MKFPLEAPDVDRPLTADELNRVHAALLDVERLISMVPSDVEHWARLFSVQASTLAPPCAANIHLIPRPKHVSSISEATHVSLWDRVKAWWFDD